MMARIAELKGKKRALVVFAVVLMVVSGSYLPGKFSLTITDSVKYRLFWIDSRTDRLDVGNYVVFGLDKGLAAGVELPEQVVLGEKVLAIKRIGCDQGQVLRVRDRVAHCGENLISVAKTHSLEGVPLKAFEFTGVIPDGFVYLVGDSQDSFDSRYFGLISRSEIMAWARPIF
ncbi:S26 family signal peptidase [Geoalkalibacter halelectricus]|uniref:S26 family signal peptidase n=1 Tax=Geoalkalibacter halelectricus TaxID=2847045 RepID=UPI00266E96BE|nr:S26 family signal peptidase [Geoalkalibacter halelectricus]MDO3380345.1 S26 family signal peptidase [Geoalkalibacter halelectricus]